MRLRTLRLPAAAGRVASWALVLAVWIGTAWLRADATQTAAVPDGVRSTLAGVYTTEQADKGKMTFANICQGCHNAASQSGTAFANKWKGQFVADLYWFIDEQMPKDDPGSVTSAEKVLVIAYLFKLNGLPAGTLELPSDVEALKKIRIELPPVGGGGIPDDR